MFYKALEALVRITEQAFPADQVFKHIIAVGAGEKRIQIAQQLNRIIIKQAGYQQGEQIGFVVVGQEVEQQ